METDHRVVFVSGSLKLGGASTFLLNLGGELVRRKIPVLIVGLEHENPYVSDFELLSIPLHVEDERRNIFEDRLSSALRIIRGFEPTVVISCLGPSSYEILRYIPKGVARLGMVQADAPDIYPVFAAYKPFLDASIGVSRQIQINLRSHPTLSCVPAYYLPYGIPIPQSIVRPIREPGEPIRILYLGRLCRPQKRVHLFPEILRHLKAAEIAFEWTIAGDGPERTGLEKQMSSDQQGALVKFTGAVEYRHVPELLDAHDIFLLASDAEGLPLSLLEAMVHGLVPVVSNLKSGIPQVVDPECGISVEPEDVAGYAAGIVQLARNPNTLRTMSKIAAERVRGEYSVQAMTDRWLGLFKNSREKIDWPQEFRVSGPINEARHWKYTASGRVLRKLARIFKIH